MRRPHDGSGLGLAICKRFVELHGGAIWAESERGKGTIFAFTVPLIGNVASVTLRPEWETWVRLPAAAEPERSIVLVSADEQIQRLFQRYLDAYRILPAADVDEALAIFRQTPVHGIVLTGHPRADLYEQLGRLRAAPRGGIGVAEYLIKPISGERLLQTLARVARKARVVLVVDDDPEMVRLLARMIRSGSRRYQVLRAYGGYSALELLVERRPDVVILDLVMPDLDGYGVLREMHRLEELRSIPVIAVTARGYEAETVAAGALSITREGGLSVGELMICLRSSLDAITRSSSSAEGLPAGAPR
jgi:CheY-like chemotaxis protein